MVQSKRKKQRQPKQLKQANNKKSSATNQVRIISGQFKRSNISFIDADGLRPTPDRMRETLFSWLMNDVHGARVLDACAGSGVLGFEALSRGAESAIFIESNQEQYQQLIKSAAQLKLSPQQAHIYHGKAEEIITKLESKPESKPFDLIFLDPPYSANLWQTLMNALLDNQLLHSNSLIYIEADKPLTQIFDSTTDNTSIDKLNIIKEKKMGQVHTWLVNFSN